MFDVTNGFDIVIGNPPYGINVGKGLNNYFEEKYRCFAGRGESYTLFTEYACNLLAANGSLMYIIPNTLLALGFTKKLRDLLLKHTSVKEIVSLPAKIFENAVVDTIILHCKKEEYVASSFNESLVSIKAFAKNERMKSIEHGAQQSFLSTSSWFQLKSFNLRSNEDQGAVVEKMTNNANSLSEYVEMFSGVKVYEVGKGVPAQTEHTRDTKPFTANTQRTKNWKPFFEGKHISRYSIIWDNNNWINYGLWLAAPREAWIFEGEKILIRKITGKNLTATYVNETIFCNTLLFVLKITETKSHEVSYKSLLGILNSTLIGWYYRRNFQIDEADTFPQIMIRDILQFPVPNIPRLLSKQLEILVDQILDKRKKGEDTTVKEGEVDILVYELYGLTEDEIRLVIID